MLQLYLISILQTIVLLILRR